MFILHFKLSSRFFLPRTEGTCPGLCGFNPHGIRQVPSAVDRPNSMCTYFMDGPLNYCHIVFFPFRLKFNFPTRKLNSPMWSYFLIIPIRVAARKNAICHLYWTSYKFSYNIYLEWICYEFLSIYV